jgi:hypothetical protein
LLNDILIDYYLKNDKSKLIQTNINTYKLPFEIKRQLLLNCIYGVDKDYNAVEAAKFGLLLKLLEDEDTNSTNKTKPVLPDLSQNVFFGNSLLNPKQVTNKKDQAIINPFDFSKLRFDVIVGNPPYMKSEDMKNITPLELPLYKTNYNSAYKQFDKYFLFLEQGINLLADDGILGYIVPSKFTKVGAGKKLREILADKEYLNSIVSFGANQVFADKTTYTCLLILNKKPQKTFQYGEVKSLKSWIVREPNAVKYEIQETKTLDSEVWVLIPSELKPVFKKIITQSTTLENLLDEKNITNGIQTSKNPLYIITIDKIDNSFIYFEIKGKKWKIEKDIVRPYYKTPSSKKLKEKFNTYKFLSPNSFVIFPYKKENGKVGVILEPELRKNFPLTHSYFKYYEKEIKNRDVSPPINKDDWFKFGRSQHLDSWEAEEKIVVGVLSTGEKYPIDKNKTIVSSGGTAGYCIIALPDTSDYSIYYIQAILNSKYLEWFSALYGEVFRGGYIARGTKVLKNLPIRKIDFSDAKQKALHDKIVETQKELISIYDQIDANAGNKRALTPLQGQFIREKAILEKLLAKLYDLGSEDSLIPLIKELYEAN